MRRRAPIAPLAAAALLLAGATAPADPTNYQRYVIGERALGMAGAYTGAVDDSMALYYNPGALPFAETTAVSASKSLYSADKREIRDGFVPDFSPTVDAVDLDTTTDQSWPSTLTFMTAFGRKKKGAARHALGFAVFVPYQDTYQFRAKARGAAEMPELETYYLEESYRTVWTGIAYAVRPTPRFGVGLAGFFSNYIYSRRLDTNTFDPPADTSACGAGGCGELALVESMLRLKVDSIVFRLGALLEATDRWRLGLAVTAPSIFLPKVSKGSLDQTYGRSSTGDPLTNAARLYSDDYSLEVAGTDPASVRVGVAYAVPKRFTVDLDASVHFPISYDRIDGDPVAARAEADPDASPRWFDAGVVHQIDRRTVFNANLGGEFLFPLGFTLRTGLFTDLSAAPDVVPSDAPQLTRVNRIGGTLSLGHKGKEHDITIGAIGTYGVGEASVYQPETARSSGESAFMPERFQERTIFVFIAGVQKALEDRVEKLLDKLSNK